MRWIYDEMIDPSAQELNNAGKKGWEIYATDGNIYKLKRLVK